MGLNVKGFKEMQENLMKLDVKTGVKFLRKAGRKAMKPVEAHQKEKVHKDTGDTAAAITISTRKGGKTSRDRVVLIEVGPTKKSSGTGEDKKKLTGVNQKAIAQEYGNIKTEADPFIRPSLELNQQKVLDVVKSEFKKSVEKIK